MLNKIILKDDIIQQFHSLRDISMGRRADGGDNFGRARNFGTIHLPGSRGIRGAILPGERTDWFRIDVANRRLKSGSFSYSAFSIDEDLLQAQVNLFFRPGNQGGLQRVESFPAVSDTASVEFDIKSPGSFYIQVSARPVVGEFDYSMTFSAFDQSENGQNGGTDLFN